jgi:AAA domain-containing protein
MIGRTRAGKRRMQLSEAEDQTQQIAGNGAPTGTGPMARFDSGSTPKSVVRTESKFTPLGAAELLDASPEPLVWVWEPYLPEGALCLLAAYMKVGKSTMAYALAVSVAQGGRSSGRRRRPVQC